MRFTVAVCGVILGAACCSGSLDPRAGVYSLLGRVCDRTRQAPVAGIALEFLERIAEADEAGVRAESGEALGLTVADVQELLRWTKDPVVRAEAFRKIGQTRLPEAKKYLQTRKQADYWTPYGGFEVWSAIQIARREFDVRAEADQSKQIALLEAVLKEQLRDGAGAAVRLWAVDELCERGSTASLPVIRSTVKELYWAGSDSGVLAFCEAQIEVLGRSASRVEALATALEDAGNVQNDRLTQWAYLGLYNDGSPEALAALERFAAEISRMPTDSPVRQKLEGYRRAIAGIRKNQQR